MAVLHAQPYNLSASGFYFDSLEDYHQKYNAHLPIEEYAFQFISGTENERIIYSLLADGEYIDLNNYFRAIDEIEDHHLPALYYLMDEMSLDFDSAMDNIDDVYVHDGDAKHYLNHVYIPEYMTDLSDLNINLIDLPSLGYDYSINHMIDDQGMNPTELGLYVFETYLLGNLMNTKNEGISPDYYIDVDTLLAVLENEQVLDQFQMNGKSYTITNLVDVVEMRNNPAICNDGTISSSGSPSKMNTLKGKQWSYWKKQGGYSDPEHSRGVCTRHGGVEEIITKKKYEKMKEDDLVTYRRERHPKVKVKAKVAKGKAKKKTTKKNPLPQSVSFDEWVSWADGYGFKPVKASDGELIFYYDGYFEHADLPFFTVQSETFERGGRLDVSMDINQPSIIYTGTPYRESNLMLTDPNEITHYDVHGYFDTLNAYHSGEDYIFTTSILLNNQNYNDSGSETGSFSYAVKPNKLKRFEDLIELLNGTITSIRAFTENGEVEYFG